MDAKNKIIETIISMSGKYSPYSIFTDWVTMSAIAIQNGCYMFHDKTWEARERLYCDTASKYDNEEQKRFGEMFVLLGDALTDEMSDVLGYIYMAGGMGSKYTGQFFTPYHLSDLTARMMLASVSDDEVIELNEPSCGGGGMIIAACKSLADKGINYQRRLRVIAQDLDWKSVYMTYLQLSLIGCSAVVVQGDTLSDIYIHDYPPERIMRTPALLGVLP